MAMINRVLTVNTAKRIGVSEIRLGRRLASSGHWKLD